MRIFHVSIPLSKVVQSRINTAFLYKRIFHVLRVALQQDKNPEKFYMEYVTPLDVDLTSLEHYPSIEISKNDLQ